MNKPILSIRVPLSLVSALALLTACAVGPDYQRPNIQLPQQYLTTGKAAEQIVIPNDWWSLYKDQQLNALIEKVLAQNWDVKTALAKIDEAQANLTQVSSALLPTINFGLNSDRSRSSAMTVQGKIPGIAHLSTTHGPALSTSFQLDFFGQLHRATEGAKAELLASRYGKEIALLTATSITAQNYFALRALDEQILLTQKNVEARKESLELVKKRVKAGLVSQLDLQQAKGALANVSAQYQNLIQQRHATQNQLAILSAQPELSIEAGNLQQLAQVNIPAYLPSQLLERRPDVKAAEQRLVAANANIGFAKAAQLPAFSMTARYGGQAEIFGDLKEKAARTWGVGLGFTVPIFDAGKSAAKTQAARAQHQAALIDYQKTAQTAFAEVSNALKALEQTQKANQDLQDQVDATSETLRLSKLRYGSGYSDYLEVLDAQRSALQAEVALVENRQQYLNQSIELIRALGGGWSFGVTQNQLEKLQKTAAPENSKTNPS